MFDPRNAYKSNKTLDESALNEFGTSRSSANTDIFIRVDPDANVSVWPSK